MKLIKNGLVVLGSLCVILILLEIVFRFLPVRSVLHTDVLNDAKPIPSYLANEKGVWSRDWNFSIVNTLVTNNLGFVNPQDYIKTDKSVVAVIGDSFVEAAMTPYDRTFYGRMAAKLRPENTQVYTFAMSGAQLPDYLVWARYAVSQFAPQHMVFVIIPNDYDESLAKNKQAPGSYYFYENEDKSLSLGKVDFVISPLRRFVRSSALLRYVTQNLQVWERLKEILYDAPSQAGTLDATAWIADAKRAVDFFFDELDKVVRIDHKDVLFLIDGSVEDAYGKGNDTPRIKVRDAADAYLAQVARSHGYRVIELPSIFRKHYQAHGQPFVYPTDGHWNELAHQLVSETILGSELLATPQPAKP